MKFGQVGKTRTNPLIQRKLSAPTAVFAKKPQKKSEPDDMPGKLRGGKQPVKSPPNPSATAKRLKGVKI